MVVAQLDATDRIHHVRHGTHTDLDEMINSETRELLNCFNEQLRTTVGVGRVDLIPPDPGDLRVGISRDRQGDSLAVRCDVDQHNRVGTLGIVETILHGAVRTRVGTREQVRGSRRVCATGQGRHATHVRVCVPQQEPAPGEDQHQEQAQGLQDRVSASAPRSGMRCGGAERCRGGALGLPHRELTRPVA